jgi:hypothetical protein
MFKRGLYMAQEATAINSPIKFQPQILVLNPVSTNEALKMGAIPT